VTHLYTFAGPITCRKCSLGFLLFPNVRCTSMRCFFFNVRFAFRHVKIIIIFVSISPNHRQTIVWSGPEWYANRQQTILWSGPEWYAPFLVNHYKRPNQLSNHHGHLRILRAVRLHRRDVHHVRSAQNSDQAQMPCARRKRRRLRHGRRGAGCAKLGWARESVC